MVKSKFCPLCERDGKKIKMVRQRRLNTKGKLNRKNTTYWICPRCKNEAEDIVKEFFETMGGSDSLGLNKKSGEKDDRGKSIKEERRRVKGNVENKITIDRSKRLKGIPETEVTHEVIKNGKTIHGPHIEPKGKRKVIQA
jgi:hypothetical protein